MFDVSDLPKPSVYFTETANQSWHYFFIDLCILKIEGFEKDSI
jgi:hypothetical protein